MKRRDREFLHKFLKAYLKIVFKKDKEQGTNIYL